MNPLLLTTMGLGYQNYTNMRSNRYRYAPKGNRTGFDSLVDGISKLFVPALIVLFILFMTKGSKSLSEWLTGFLKNPLGFLASENASLNESVEGKMTQEVNLTKTTISDSMAIGYADELHKALIQPFGVNFSKIERVIAKLKCKEDKELVIQKFGKRLYPMKLTWTLMLKKKNLLQYFNCLLTKTQQNKVETSMISGTSYYDDWKRYQ